MYTQDRIEIRFVDGYRCGDLLEVASTLALARERVHQLESCGGEYRGRLAIRTWDASAERYIVDGAV